ncbi:hypothetical protein D3C79_745910 [compost metagenome]
MLTPAGLSAAALATIGSQPSMKSVGSVGSGCGLQRRRLGVTAPSGPASGWRARRSKRGCSAEGRMRYSQVRRNSLRVMVNAVPESSSAYSPYGAFCGEFCPTGSAPGSASLANSLPKPLR